MSLVNNMPETQITGLVRYISDPVTPSHPECFATGVSQLVFRGCESIVPEVFGTEGSLVTTHKLLSSDPNTSGKVVDEVIEVGAHPPFYNTKLGFQMLLAMSVRPYTAANVCG
jgi:hypothetical protein